MSNLLTISTMLIGIISIVIILGIIALFVILNIKKGGKLSAITLAEFLVAFILAVLLAKPILALFDKIFSFSMVFYNMFMLDFGQIDSFNTKVTFENYNTVVENFKSSSVGVADNLKSFFIKVFEKSNPPTEGTTTLGAIASRSLSYMLCLFLMTIILFVVIYVLVKILSNFLDKKFKFKKQKQPQKVLGGIIGFFKGLFVSVLAIVMFSTIPFFGTAIDYIGSGFQTTKIFDAPYQLVVNLEQDLYVSTNNFAKITKRCYQNTDDVQKAHYQNEVDTHTRYRVDIYITNDTITIYAEDLINYTSINHICDFYILSNNTLYLYQSNKLLIALGYNTKTSTIRYKNIIDGVKVDYTLKIV